VDVAAAAAAVTKTFANLAKLAKVAEEAGKGTEEAADAVKALKEAASHEPNGKVLVEGIERHFQGASKEGEILEAFGGTKREAELFEASTKAADEAAQATVPSAKTIAGGEVKATRAGLFSCHSPCTTIRGKFAQELAAREDLNKQLLDLEAELVAKQGDADAMKSIAERAAKIEDELRQTVTFESPLRSEPNFGDLVKRRGSGAENLTSKPPDWTGANEAAFKYGKEVGDLEKAGLKDGYYWRLDQEGNLSLIRKDAELPKMRYNPQEGKFVEVEDQVAAALERLGQLEAASLNKLASWGLDGAAVERILAKGANAGHIKGQLLEELLNLKMARPGALAEHVPAGLIERLERQGAKLEFIPGHAITDADGRLITDGIIGYWEGDRFKIVTFFEAKGGAPAARGLRYSWTGIPKAERAELFQKAEEMGLAALGKDETYQDLAEALSEAASDVKATRKAASKLTLDEVLKQFPNDVKRAWSELPQSEAGQIRKTTERLTEGGGKLRINGKEVQTSTIGGWAPRAVGVLPGGVTEEALEKTLKEGGIRSFERLHDIPQSELDDMAKRIAETGAAKPNPNP
jgi:hypothetical protein